MCRKLLCQNKFLHKEVILRDSILGHKFQHNVLIMRKGNIQCFVLSPVNYNSSGLEREFTGLAVVTHLCFLNLWKILKGVIKQWSIIIKFNLLFSSHLFSFCVHLSLISFGFFIHTVWPPWIQNLSGRMVWKPPT